MIILFYLPFFFLGGFIFIVQLFLILEKFKGGLLLIEDISKYISDSLPQDIVGNICTNRHNDLDIIIQLQSVGRITPKLLQNLNLRNRY